MRVLPLYLTIFLSLLGGEDFNALIDHRLTFSSSDSNSPHNISLDIYLDGLFEDDETFNATLTTGFLPLELNVKTVNLRDSLCHEEIGSTFLSIPNHNSKTNDVSIAFDRVLLSNDVGDIEFRLANTESNRVRVGPLSTRVTILDNDSE